jgi:hypothetical protein
VETTVVPSALYDFVSRNRVGSGGGPALYVPKNCHPQIVFNDNRNPLRVSLTTQRKKRKSWAITLCSCMEATQLLGFDCLEVLYADIRTSSEVEAVYNSKRRAIDTSTSHNIMSVYNEEFAGSDHCQLRFCLENFRIG